ncbi:putative ubiquitin-conjugating enzyme E2 38 isoform X2 [Silene latifolia]|uniref:putative ubiquitin-conjugating enzyme E2 38 isoform X2 n=1 Tax=Silene latifolia TaxID=37657 RepID=UPI003D7811A2
MDMEVDDDSQTSPPLISKKLKQEKNVLATDIAMSTGVVVTVGSTNIVKNSISGSNNSSDRYGSTSDLSYQEDTNDDEVDAIDDMDEAIDDVDEAFDDDDFGNDDDVLSDNGIDDDDDDYVDDDDDDDAYLKLQAQFDNVDLPPGVEATVSWLQDPSPSEEKHSATGPSTSQQVDKGSGASSSKAESSLKIIKEETMDDVLRKLMYFKQFDTVTDSSDHHFNDVKSSGRQPAKSWAKKVQDEWKILEQNLPETIYVRVYESRMDLLRAVIIGPAGTPYHDGLFVFDVFFPPSYPSEPPRVHYHSSGFRLNPNLYECGKVCLSLLNTWQGGKNEMWLPDKSTMLQVLVSIQALILNTEPFYNEPGYEKTYRGEEGKKKSRDYSEDIFIKSLKKMMYTMRNPPQHFEDLVAGHFRVRAVDIMTACQAYAAGAEVSSDLKKWQEHGENAPKLGSNNFKAEVAKMMKPLLKYFINNGSKDCDQFKADE